MTNFFWSDLEGNPGFGQFPAIPTYLLSNDVRSSKQPRRLINANIPTHHHQNNLESYINENTNQIKLVFWVSVSYVGPERYAWKKHHDVK